MGLAASPRPTVKPPLHVAIIMDGNGRWARARGLPRTFGHKAGVDGLVHALAISGQDGLFGVGHG